MVSFSIQNDIVLAFTVLRTYGVSGKSRPAAVVVAVVGYGLMGTSLVRSIHLESPSPFTDTRRDLALLRNVSK